MKFKDFKARLEFKAGAGTLLKVLGTRTEPNPYQKEPELNTDPKFWVLSQSIA